MPDIDRIANRVEIKYQKWLEESEPDPAVAIVETPIYRQELGLWAHQKYFIKKAFEDRLRTCLMNLKNSMFLEKDGKHRVCYSRNQECDRWQYSMIETLNRTDDTLAKASESNAKTLSTHE